MTIVILLVVIVSAFIVVVVVVLLVLVIIIVIIFCLSRQHHSMSRICIGSDVVADFLSTTARLVFILCCVALSDFCYIAFHVGGSGCSTSTPRQASAAFGLSPQEPC